MAVPPRSFFVPACLLLLQLLLLLLLLVLLLLDIFEKQIWANAVTKVTPPDPLVLCLYLLIRVTFCLEIKVLVEKS